ncbi:site-specific integrase [Maribacter sp. M208]|uniref:tyrosine-type recombinase/integrase n=1 Tax=Maribacter huludaoensis TaxID=3030010 RepID=UPI0023EC9FD7|nr:site-specific integrase [Maribacter huludaoensis]MDF4221093.1 site-specific integrase [Maribacter huludaoensis]
MSVKLRTRNLAKGVKRYYLDIYHNKERSYQFLDIKITPSDTKRSEKKRLAENIRANKELELISLGSSYQPEHLKDLNFNLFAEDFIKNYKYKDIRIVASAVAKFKDATQNKKLKISQITPSVMETYKTYLIHDAKLSGETAHNYFTRFKKVLRNAKIKGYIKSMPTDEIRFKNPNKEDTLRKQVLTPEELQLLANTHCGNSEVKKAFLFCCYTSLGMAEIRKLKWKNIKNNRLETTREKTGGQINNRLNSVAVHLIGERKNSEDFVFDLQIISDNAVNKNLKYWIQRTEIDKHLTFYCARHTFACLLLMNGANLKTVADAMGHSSTKSTLKYLNHVQKLQDNAIDNLPEITF